MHNQWVKPTGTTLRSAPAAYPRRWTPPNRSLTHGRTMKNRFRCTLMTLPIALVACSPAAEFPPATASESQLETLLRDKAEELRSTPPHANGVRSFGLFFERDDGTYAAEKGGRVIIVQQDDGAYLLGYYMPLDGGGFERIGGEPLRVAATRIPPRVGNPRGGTGTCLRAPLVEASGGEWYGCVEKGRLVTGIE